MRKIDDLFHSLRFRIMACTVVCLVLSVLVPVQIISRIQAQRFMDADETHAFSAFDNIEANIAALLENASEAVHMAESKKAVDDYVMNMNAYSSLYERVKAKIAFDKTMSDFFYMYKEITDILFIRADGSVAGSSLDWHYSSPAGMDWVREAYAEGCGQAGTNWFGSLLASEIAPIDSAAITTRSGQRVCGVSRVLRTYSGSALEEGIVSFVAIDEQALRNRYSFLADSDSDIMILNDKGVCLSCSRPSLVGRGAAFWEKIPETAYSAFSYTDENGRDYQVICKRLGFPSWILVKKVPLQTYLASSRNLVHIALVISLITIVTVCLLCAIWIRQLFQPLVSITEAFSLVREGDLDTRIELSPSAPSEIRLVAEQTNQMLESITDLVHLNETNERTRSQMEMRSLQAQLAPHFLFNTLTSIRWSASLAGDSRTADMLSLFAQLLRPVFRDWTMTWSLREELDYAANYISLVCMRYNGLISMQIDCGGVSPECSVPRFMLQPILENSCEHALPEHGTLEISVSMQEVPDGLVVRVADNGTGMSEETLARLRENLLRDSEPEPSSSGRRSIGMYNIHKRIGLYYGEGYGIHVDSAPNQGTTVEIHIGRSSHL